MVAIAAGADHSFALCSDGTLASWGSGEFGQLGNGGVNDSTLPVAVDRSGILSGKAITGIHSGGLHHFAWCSDGTLAAWGFNAYGQLGDGSTTDRFVPVDVTRSGALAGKKGHVARRWFVPHHCAPRRSNPCGMGARSLRCAWEWLYP